MHDRFIFSRVIGTLFLLATLTYADPTNDNKDNWRKVNIPPSPSLSAQDALGTFKLAPGFAIEAVASEPALDNPVAMAWDGNGRMWVVQMSAFMATVTGKGEDARTGKVTVFEDTNNDGKMDRHVNFLTGLLRPRAITMVKGGVLVSEPPTLWYCKDTDGDLVCDEKINVGKYARAGAPEHTENGLVPALDNWMYSAKSKTRHRFVDGKLISEATLFRGQWGITQGNYGRLYYTGNSNLRQHDWETYRIEEKASTSREQGAHELNTIRMNYGVNRGYLLIKDDSDGRLNVPTAVSGPAIYRDNFYGERFQNGYFAPDPAGNVVTYFEMSEKRGKLNFHHKTYDDATWGKREFLASTDERFRPVNLYTGPDRCLYVVDMYHGILQHKAFLTMDYLAKQITHRKLDKENLMGRVYRIVPTDKTVPRVKPNMLNESPAQWVAHLENPNGWWRDTAQRLLVQAQDTSVVPALEELARSSERHLAKIHALWTLQGLDALDKKLMTAAQEDPHPKVALTARLLMTGLPTINYNTRETNESALSAADRAIYRRGKAVYEAGCVACHQPNGKGLEKLAPRLAGSDWMKKKDDILIRVILNGLQGPITVKGKDVDSSFQVMPGHAALLDDDNIAEVLSYIRNTWGNKGRMVTRESVVAVRKIVAKRSDLWTENELKRLHQ
ncbi:MAG: mono/diheme cytochrome c family protein [Kiritimatiellia bacterium]|jgi:mono/diheme cytochrome c family protein